MGDDKAERSTQRLKDGLFYVGPIQQEERVFLGYLIVFSVIAAAGSVAWLGWTWPALLLTFLSIVLASVIVVVLSVQHHRRESSQSPEWR